METVDGARLGSFADYAKHRGVSKAAVSKTVKKSWFTSAVGTLTNGKKGIVDFALADRLWTQHADQTRASIETKERLSRIAVATPPAAGDTATPDPVVDEPPGLAPEMSLADATRTDKYWSAMRKKQEFEREAGLLVSVSERDADEATRITYAKTRLLGIPSKLKATAPNIEHGIVVMVDALIREALEDLASAGDKAHVEAA